MATKSISLIKDADQILQGIRIVLPGTQALMGFQFIAFFNPTFTALPQNLKGLHFIALLLTVHCSLCLIAPVAYQQIGEQGDATRRFLSFTRLMLGIAMLLLLGAIAADTYLAAQTIGIDEDNALNIAGGLFVIGIALWFLFSFLRRNGRNA